MMSENVIGIGMDVKVHYKGTYQIAVKSLIQVKDVIH